MKASLSIISVVFVLSIFAGCGPDTVGKKLDSDGRKFLTVDFHKDQTLRYKFVSSRTIELDWGSKKGTSKTNRPDTSFESMEMVVAYTPVDIDPYGLTTIRANCETVKVNRTSGRSRKKAKIDAVKSFEGETFTLKVAPTGKIEDRSELDELFREIGKKAFRIRNKHEKIKDPDMIGDIVALQWFLWDSISSIEKPADGVSVGQMWTSQLSVPAPMVMRKARDVTYTLAEIRPTEKGQMAVITSSYSAAKTVPNSWPIPYSGSFLVSGMFGFLRNYRIIELSGQGEELFNIDLGRTEKYEQQYQMRISASLSMPLGGVRPKITIKQKLTMQLLED